MQQKTKIAYMLFLIGFLMFIIPLLLLGFAIIPIANNMDAWLVVVFVSAIGFFLMLIAGRMLKIRFRRWVRND